MALAFKCDGCKEFFAYNPRVTVTVLTSKAYANEIAKKLCDNCTKALEELWRDLANQPKAAN